MKLEWILHVLVQYCTIQSYFVRAITLIFIVGIGDPML